jgi:hypothetical protein
MINNLNSRVCHKAKLIAMARGNSWLNPHHFATPMVFGGIIASIFGGPARVIQPVPDRETYV